MSTINPTTSAAQAAQLYAAGIAEDGQDYTEETSGGSSSHSVEQSADHWESSENESSPYVSYDESGCISGTRESPEIMHVRYWADSVYMANNQKELFESFLRGEATLDDIKANYAELMEKLKSAPRGEFTNPMPDDEYLIALNDSFAETYAHALKYAVINYNTEEAISKYGEMDRTQFSYLNAEYYYQCKDMLSAVSDAKKSVLRSNGLDENAGRELGCTCAAKDFMRTAYTIFKDFGAEPPRDMKFFFKPAKYTQEELREGTCYYLNWQTPANGLCYGVGLPIRVPKGVSLLLRDSKLNEALFPKLTMADNPLQPRGRFAKSEVAYDLSWYIAQEQSDPENKHYYKFAKENFFNDYAGEITIEVGGRSYTKDIPFYLWTDELKFNASEFCDTEGAGSTSSDEAAAAFLEQFTLYSWSGYSHAYNDRNARYWN